MELTYLVHYNRRKNVLHSFLNKHDGRVNMSNQILADVVSHRESAGIEMALDKPRLSAACGRAKEEGEAAPCCATSLPTIDPPPRAPACVCVQRPPCQGIKSTYRVGLFIDNLQPVSV